MNDIYDSAAIGKELKRLRTEHTYTQEQMAEQLGCTPAFISNIENNRARLNLRVLAYYAKLFHASVDSILKTGQNKAEPQNASDALDAEALEVLHQFPPSKQKQIIKILDYIASMGENTSDNP